ncbi:MAG: NYN domain-containing protein [Chloroflexota bacterium]|nr:NYN domain-containing protein [Chloroflexota bacterium]
MLTNVYVDGFNLYYRALRGTAYRWLDLRALAGTLFPNDTVRTIHYFTALLTRRPNDPTQPQRQQAYLRALATLPDLQIHYGTFRSGTRRAVPTRNPSSTIEVFHTEEKGSDVNLAVQLMADGFNRKYEGNTSRRLSSPAMPTS